MFIKKSTLLLSIFAAVLTSLILTTQPAHAAPIDSFPVTVTQPDGSILNLFVSGDEYYNWLHDANGYTIIQDPVTGYYVDADLVNGELVPTQVVAGTADPATAGLQPYLNISPTQKEGIRQAAIDKTRESAGVTRNAPSTGTITNLVIFIRFSGESEFTDATSLYTNMLNSSVAGANSLRNYYREVSYNALTVNSSLFPTPGSTILSYQDSHPRSYYQPYNAVTNPTGYVEATRAQREHALLRSAINYVAGLGQFPSGATIDGDDDGMVDSLTFVVSGEPDGWSELLWPHASYLFSETVTINGKEVGGYQFQLQSMITTGVLAHEMFHVLGAPDLYHYEDNGIQPVGGWDVMEYDPNPPQHMSCYMKFQYGGWISSLPELTTPGTYTLNPLTSSTNNCKKISSPYSTTEYFVVEYRNAGSSTFESSLPGNGLLVYRINTLAYGNAEGPPDEVYVYRPGGTTSVNGNVNIANFSSTVGRTQINDSTDPSSFLSDGSDGGLNLCNIGASGATISFNICPSDVYAISGDAGVAEATLSYIDGTSKTVTADAYGQYTLAVPSGWSGTVTPSKPGFTFSPASRSYTNVVGAQIGQDYTASDSYEPDNAPGQAKLISSGVAQTHSVTPATDVDWVTFTLNNDSAVILETSGATNDDTRMWLYASDNLVDPYGFSDDKDPDNWNWYSYLEYTCDAPLPAGTYYVMIDEYDNDSPISSYALSYAVTQTCSSGADTTGVFRPTNGILFLKNTHNSGFADIGLNYGIPGDYPVVGDWDGNGTATIGVYRNGSFYLRNSNTIGFADIVFAFGQVGDQPVAGDWDGDGVDTIGIYRPSIGLFLLRNSNSAGPAQMSFYLGNVGDVGIAGDWDGDGLDTTGVFRPINGILFLKNANTSGFADIALNYGIPGDKPVTGDWDDNGTDTIGVYRNGRFFLRNQNTIGFADIVFDLGNPGDMPIAGNWDGLP